MLDSYQEGQAIFGRDVEISSISESIIYNIQTFLYGKSGMGKTSILQAGVFPILRKKHFFPVVIRLANSDEMSLRKLTIRLVEQEAEREDLSICKCKLNHLPIDKSDLANSQLWEYFAKMHFFDDNGDTYIPVLIFDQFEETINNEENWQKTVDFLKDDLYDLLDSSLIPSGASLDYSNYRIVISMREDYLYCMEDIIDTYSLWEFRYNRFRIKAMDDKSAEQVIRNTWGEERLERGKEKAITKSILKLTKINSGSRFTEINSAILSLVCSLINDNSVDGIIRLKDVGKVNLYLLAYYDGLYSDRKIGYTAMNFLEETLLTKDGRRSSIDEKEAVSSGKITKEQLKILEDKRLIKKIKTDNTITRYEYVHDIFAKIIYKQKRESNKYSPYYRISGTLDSLTFLKKTILASTIIICVTYLYLLLHAYTQHDHSLNAFGCYNYFLVMGIAALCIYLVPLMVSRLHDIGHSGWWLFLLVVLIFPLVIDHGLVTNKRDDVFSLYDCIISIILISMLFFLAFAQSKQTPYSPKFSYRCERVARKLPTSNGEFAIMIGFELCCWVVIAMLSELFYCVVIKSPNLVVFRWTLPLPFFDLFGIIIEMPTVISVFPFAICGSIALRARLKTIGYKTWWAWIPYFNILLLIECLFSETILDKLHLINHKAMQKNRDDDGVIEEIELEFEPKLSDNEIITQILTNHNINPKKAFWVPLFSWIMFFKSSDKLSKRYYAFMGVMKLFLLIAIVFLMSYAFDDSTISIVQDCLLLALLVLYIIYIVTFILYRRLIMQKVKEIKAENQVHID